MPSSPPDREIYHNETSSKTFNQLLPRIAITSCLIGDLIKEIKAGGPVTSFPASLQFPPKTKKPKEAQKFDDLMAERAKQHDEQVSGAAKRGLGPKQVGAVLGDGLHGSEEAQLQHDDLRPVQRVHAGCAALSQAKTRCGPQHTQALATFQCQSSRRVFLLPLQRRRVLISVRWLHRR